MEGKTYENKIGSFVVSFGNLIGNIYKMISGEISKEKYTGQT